jgi:ribose transport system substrate-binding protein
MTNQLALRRLLLTALSIAAVAATAGCSSAGAESSPGSDGAGEVSIAVMSCTESPYCAAGNDAMEAAAAELGIDTRMFDAVLDPTKTVASCNDAISTGKYDAIVISTVIPSASVACATAADAAGIPLVSTVGPVGTDTASAEPTAPGVVAQVLIPLDDQMNALVDDVLVPACADVDPCEVGWLRTPKSLPQGDAILDATLQRALSEHPNIEIVGETASENDVGEAIAATKSFLQRNPGLDVIISYSSQAISGALKGLQAEGKVPGDDVLVVATGASEAVMTALRAGEVYGTTVNLPATEMRVGIETAVKAARGETVPSAIDPLDVAGLPIVITQENLADYPDFTGEYTQ